ncbi:protein obstructor-E-like [Pogonomyrmex barbatus]|uniref:Protein obstructor-E-like n=1 Tax=Pogonomyrmex barbatus TaxID=144034 RepID=A0A8N1S592_9HYME|nr:protein obstructor-E-like [Pogonomyrmex barbatus]
MTNENNNEHKTYDNLDPSTCIGTCPDEDSEYAVLLPNDDCKKYCMCSNGVAWVMPCPEPLYFDSVEKIFITRSRWHKLIKIDNNNSMKSLINENNYERKTYDNLDPSTCIGTCPDEDPEYAVLLPNDDCKKYCMCSNGVAWVMPCPEPLYFDSVEKICKLKKNAVCGKRSSNQDDILTIDNMVDNDNLILSRKFVS